MKKLYPDSGVELSEFTAKNYDKLMNIALFGKYKGFIQKAISDLNIKENDKILDLGCGTGRNILLMNKYLSKDSLLVGVDISEDMKRQFYMNCKAYPNIKFINKRIDQFFELHQEFDKVFISFVIHGFPHEIRKIIIQNAYHHLKKGGTFNILDFAEFNMKKMPFHHRLIFKKIECKYAFDFIERDWEAILKEYGFENPTEKFYFKNYVRLLSVEKNIDFMKINVAFATDNGKTFMDRHFGDAEYYDVYEISKTDSKFIKRIFNTTEEGDESIHADPEKAKGIAGLFKNENIKVVVSKFFGPNIKRIKKKFVCVLMNDNSISQSIKNIQQNIYIITNEWSKGEERSHFNLKEL